MLEQKWTADLFETGEAAILHLNYYYKWITNTIETKINKQDIQMMQINDLYK